MGWSRDPPHMSDARLVPAIAVAVLVVTAGCAGFGDTGVASAEEVRQDAVASMADVETYRMEMNVTLHANGQTLPMAMTGTFNRTGETAQMTTTVRGQSVESYVDGTTMYLQTPTGWQVRDVADRNPWNESLALERQRAILESADITELGEDTVDGEPVYVVQIDPDPERVKQVVARQQNRNFDDVSIRDVTYTQFVHRETGRLVGVEMNMTMTVSGQSADVTATMTFSGYDEPTDITIPEDARAAEDSLAPTAA